MKVPNSSMSEKSPSLSLSRLQNEGSQPLVAAFGVPFKSIKATE